MSRSDAVKRGPERTPHRSLLKACGYTDAQMQKPFIGAINGEERPIPLLGDIHILK